MRIIINENTLHKSTRRTFTLHRRLNNSVICTSFFFFSIYGPLRPINTPRSHFYFYELFANSSGLSTPSIRKCCPGSSILIGLSNGFVSSGASPMLLNLHTCPG